MNYQKVYQSLIDNRKTNPLPLDQYGEIHHIIPRSMGGSNDKDNLIRLTAREHYVAHHLLWKIHKTSKMAHAWFMMLRCDPNQKRFFTARQHEAATLAHKDALRKSMKGADNHFFGKSHTEETKKKLSELNKGKSIPENQIKNWVEKVAKKPKSAEHKAKIGRSGMIMLKNIITSESIRISKSDIHLYDSNVWKNPAVQQKRITCIHCGVESTVGNINRWHNDKCKLANVLK
jgi:fructose-specific phosphotransferase system component IIB